MYTNNRLKSRLVWSLAGGRICPGREKGPEESFATVKSLVGEGFGREVIFEEDEESGDGVKRTGSITIKALSLF